MDADCCQQEVLYQLTTAEVIKTEATSESPVYCKFQLEDSDRIKSVFNQVLKLEPRYEDNDVQETKYGKLGFEEAMRDNPETSTWAGAIEIELCQLSAVDYRNYVLSGRCDEQLKGIRRRRSS